ncbi:hypothetical protein F383_30468 [Gossypium arboreum]|uniref:Uncharacterized protein n=1 Tax=Gossypium arboreum TaxID=29729 RepID=A0A0B0PI47_GOSAR|nr:hypothetical protein F383_30468 [Gossypium arboreum]
MLVLYVPSVAEYIGICCGYLTTCCYQSSSDWRSSKIASHYQTVFWGYR